MDIVLYTRDGCCLCEQARVVLENHGLTVREVHIDDDPELYSRYTDCIPVVMMDGRERFRGKVDEVLLRRILRQ